MRRVIGLLGMFLVGIGTAVGAPISLKGRVVGGDDGQPIVGAYVMINASEPDVAKRTSLTGGDGSFSVVSREKTTVLTVSFIGYRDYTRTIAPSEGTNVDLGTIKLVPEAQTIKEVKVTAKAPMATMRGDTLQYNAAAFKTNPDASSEDLLKKMPGVTTDENGAVEVHGQTVGKVYVDGKEFFADDPAVALKTLPADVVESMQVFDDKSDESKFSGFDDGERIKAINIVTKGGVSTSTFGKVYGGYGTDNRYSVGAAANIFNTNQRWTILASRNNVNNQGFTLNDIASSMTGRRGGMGGGSDVSQFSTSVRGGIQTTTMAGLNYQGDFKKVKLNGSYFFNNVNADIWRAVGQDYKNMSRLYNDTTATKGYNYQHRANLRLEWNPNETNRIFFAPRVTYSTNHGSSSGVQTTWLDGLLNNTATNRYTTKLGTYDASANLFWMHRFGKAGRTMSLGGSVGGSNGWGDRTQRSDYGTLDETTDGGESIVDLYTKASGDLTYSTLNQIGTLGTPGFDLSARASYAEPLSQSSRIQFSYRFSYDKSESRILSYDWDPMLNEVLELDPTTSNLFDRNQTRHVGTVGYNWVKKDKMTLNASISYQYSTLNDDQTYPVIATPEHKYNFSAWLPRVRFEWKPTKMQSLNVQYRRSTSTPNVNQLQDALDLSNPLQVSFGNPDLKQSYTDRLEVHYNLADPEKSTNFHVFAFATLTQDYIANHRRFLTEDTEYQGTTIVKGAQVSSPVNLNGYASANLFGIYSFRINPLRSNMNIGFRYQYAQTPSMEDNVKYLSRSNRMGMNLSLTSNISEYVDFTLAYRPSLNFTTSRQKDQAAQQLNRTFDRYVGSDLAAFLNIFLWKGLFINADATWKNSFGTQASYSQHYALLNAGIGYKFLKYQQAEIRVSGYDLLNQNRAFRQQSFDTYTQTTLSNILKRYFMVSFTYKFDTRKGRSADNYGTDDQRSIFGGRGDRRSGGGAPMGPPPGGGGPGGPGGGGPR
ncbi:MAG: TonB-dependent receptor [Rikenella sp.]|nr:TonB-dependent receptor [Rikenella sp.]